MLVPLIPATLGICTGVVIDGAGHQSAQSDVIIFDRRVVPPLLLAAREGVVPCESVLFAIEVKSVLDRKELDKSVSWACTFKALGFDPELAPPGRRISSIPCALFAFETDLAGRRTIDDELARLKAAVSGRNNMAGPPPIHVPLSALTVATRGHIECLHAEPPPRKFKVISNPKGDHVEGALRFVSWVNRNAPALSAERETISLDRYLHD